jgi:tetratricopeptide (TPR) repeat protein
VNKLLAAVSVAGLALIAAAGVVAGFRRREPVPVEPVGDPLEDRRLALERSLEDLEDAHTSGALDDEGYGRLLRDTEGRMARLARAIDERRRRTEPEDPSVAAVPARGGTSGRVPTWAVATLLAATVGAVVVAGLLRDSGPVASAAGPTSSSSDPFAFFEQRVHDHPQDLAARLDLAHRYLDAGRFQDALTQYRAALRLDPKDAEAQANIGLILYLAGRPEDGLAAVDLALQSAPEYPEALFFRGLILLRGLDRPADAIDAFERYLEAAPFGSERARVQQMIDRARAELAG